MKSNAAIFGLCALFIMAGFIIVPTQAWAKSFINKNEGGVALRGYDSVAYFTLGKPVEGKKEIVDGKLHLNYSREIQKKWEKDIPGYIKKADENWPAVLD